MYNSENKAQKINTIQAVLAILLAIFILVLAQEVSMIIGSLFVKIGIPVAIGNILAGVLYPVFTLFGVSILCKKVLRISLIDCKITKLNLKPIWCFAAFVMPILVSTILFFTPGHWEKTSMNAADIGATLTGGIIFIGLATGIVEETIFRGVIMSALEYRFNKRVAIFFPSILFGLLHIIGSDLDGLSIIQLAVAGSAVGILFSLVTYESGSIWCSALLHAIWNMIIIGEILHVGTKADEMSIFNYVLDTESFLISGGDFGIEASIISIGVYLLFAILALSLIRKREINSNL